MLDRHFFLAGNATFTVEPARADIDRLGLKPHYTFRVRKPKPGREGEECPFFVSTLVGPENTRDYRYMGVLNRDGGTLHMTTGSKFKERSWQAVVFRRVCGRIWSGEGRLIEEAGWCVRHSGKCCRCGRKLTVPASLETGIGPECEVLVLGGFVHLDEVPQVAYPEVARVQASYWMQGLDDVFGPMRDACLDSGLTEERADQIAHATRACMRRFKKGRNWPEAFRKLVALAPVG
jgi:hypothetical protein